MEFVFTVSESEANVLIQSLAAQPYGAVHALIAKLQAQAARQRVESALVPQEQAAQ